MDKEHAIFRKVNQGISFEPDRTLNAINTLKYVITLGWPKVVI